MPVIGHSPDNTRHLPLWTFGTSAWPLTLFAIVVVVTALGLAFSSTILGMVDVWLHSETYQFALLVLPMSLYLVWDQRSHVKQLAPRGSYLAMLSGVPFVLLWLMSYQIDLALGMQLALIGMLQAALLSLLGWRVYRPLVFPLSFLWLMVPFGEFLEPDLMRLTIQLTAAGLSLFGLTVSTDGNILISEAGRIAIVEECSSLDFLIGNLVLSLFYAKLVFVRLRKRLMYVLIGLVAAIVANNVRTTSVVLISHWSGGEWDLLSNHKLYGWLVFFAFVSAQMLIGARYKDSYVPPDPSMPKTGIDTNRGGRSTLLIAVALTILFVTTSALGRQDPNGASASTDVVLRGPAWLSPTSEIPDLWHPVFIGAHGEYLARSQIEGQMVDFYLAYYTHQDTDAELIGWPNAAYNRKQWRLLMQGSHVARFDDDALGVIETRLRGRQGERRLSWHWYWVDGRFTASPFIAKLLQAKVGLTGGDTRAAAIVVSTVERVDSRQARLMMQGFLDRATFLRVMLIGAGAS